MNIGGSAWVYIAHRVSADQKDVNIAADIVAQAERKFSSLSADNFNIGFYSPNNRQNLQPILDQVVLPKKGRLSATYNATVHKDRR